MNHTETGTGTGTGTEAGTGTGTGAGTEADAHPPLTWPGEAEELRGKLAAAARGEAFLLHAGSGIPPGAVPRAEHITRQLTLLAQGTVVLSYALGVPVVPVAEIHAPPAEGRTGSAQAPDVHRASAMALNLIRASGGDARPEVSWAHERNRAFVASSPERARYEPLTVRIGSALSFLHACGGRPAVLPPPAVSRAALADDSAPPPPRVPGGDRWDPVGHMVWLHPSSAGDCHGPAAGAAARISNPVGVVVEPGTTHDAVLALIDRLDPERSAGRLTFLTRFGADRITDLLPELVQKVAATEAEVVWACDPWHRNRRDPAGVLAEAGAFAALHRTLGTHAGGLHLPPYDGLSLYDGLPPRDGAAGRPGALDLVFALATHPSARAARDGRTV
ncbi:3-deoxy-7-phosphoheptulonate synthase [Streptomyces dioscori]|uniref:3-deoxy-7-phosphoheptulonate synthase n=1 Tax=Streptomyces dioscori TaxID=2109333 RepID=UPI00131D49ED|nr:3-deoxy-7-phosphoheptulonate synthase [Streptomyces dioscori]